MWGRQLLRLFSGSRCPPKKTSKRHPSWQLSFKHILPSSVRQHHTAPESLNCAWHLNSDHLELKFGDTLMRFDYVWLRDHCRSASCYNTKTNQRSLDTASVDLCIRPKTIRVDDTTLFLTSAYHNSAISLGLHP